MRPNKFQLAKAEFYCTREHNKVRCVCCNLTLFAWGETDKPLKEHERLSSLSLYLKIIDAEPTLNFDHLEWKTMRIKKLDFKHLT